jgi:hypothetical protein
MDYRSANPARCLSCRQAEPKPKYVRKGYPTGRRVDYVVTECRLCGQSFEDKPSATRVYCSKSCHYAGMFTSGAKSIGTRNSRAVYFRECQECDRLYTAKSDRSKCCSDACRARSDIKSAGIRVMDLYRLACGLGVDPRRWRNDLYALLRERDGDSCVCCFESIDFTLKSGTRGSDFGPSVEHLIPRSHGGTDDLDNLALSHWGCNRNRRTKSLEAVWEGR